PFFAVVAGPITALNFLDLAARITSAQAPTERTAQQWAITGRVLSILAALVLLLVGVPGWLQAEPFSVRQIGFGIKVDPGLREAALEVARWRKDGKLAEETHWFNTAPEVVNYFAYFCPGEKGFLDHRLSLFRRSSQQYLTVRKALQGEDLPQE